MKILILDAAPPHTIHSGKSVRLLNLLMRLRRRHEIHYLTIVGPAAPRDVPSWIREHVSSARVWTTTQREFLPGRYANWVAMQPWFYAPWRYPEDHRKLSAELQRLLADEHVDLVHCFDGEVAQFLPAQSACPWIDDPADAMTLHARRRAQQSPRFADRLMWGTTAWRWARYERQIMHRASATVYVSPIDAACHRTHDTRHKVHVISNGVDTEYFSPAASPPEPGSPPALILTGHMSYGPNHDAAMYLIRDLLPRIRAHVPDVACWIVGAEPRPELIAQRDGDRLVVTGRVDDLRPWMAKATVYACSMRLGAGIKNKLLESMAMGKAIVTTRRGAEGLDIRHDEHALLVDDDDEGFIRHVVALLRSPQDRARLGQAARRFVLERHSWDATVAAYESLYRQVVDAAAAAQPARSKIHWSLPAGSSGGTLSSRKTKERS